MEEVAEFLGIVSLIAMAAVIVTGVLMKRKRAPFGKIHKAIGFITLGLAICHGLTMVLD